MTSGVVSSLEKDRCGICLEDFSEENRGVPLSHERTEKETEVQRQDRDLKHLFHDHCIRPWIRGHNICPTCMGRVNRVVNGEPVGAPLVDEGEGANQQGQNPLWAAVNTDIEFNRAIVGGDLGTVRSLQNSVNPRRFDSDLRRAAFYGHLDVVQEFLQSGHITEDGIRETLEAAVAAQRTEIVRVLLQNNMIAITEAARGRALMVVGTRLPLLRDLLESGPIPQYHIEQGVSTAIDNGWLEGVRELLRYGTFSPDERQDAIARARRSGHRHRAESEFLAPRRNAPFLLFALTAGVVALSVITHFFWNRSKIF